MTRLFRAFANGVYKAWADDHRPGEAIYLEPVGVGFYLELSAPGKYATRHLGVTAFSGAPRRTGSLVMVELFEEVRGSG